MLGGGAAGGLILGDCGSNSVIDLLAESKVTAHSMRRKHRLPAGAFALMGMGRSSRDLALRAFRALPIVELINRHAYAPR